MSTDSGMFENPFREGGKLSRDAEVTIGAPKRINLFNSYLYFNHEVTKDALKKMNLYFFV